MRYSSASLIAILGVAFRASAWLPLPISLTTTAAASRRRRRPPIVQWRATTVKDATTDAAAAAAAAAIDAVTKAEKKAAKKKPLSPEFATAREMAQTQLLHSIPAAYHTQVMPLLSHFLAQYMAAAQDGYAAGLTNTCHPDTTARRFLQGIQYGLQYGMSDDRYTFDVSHKALRGTEGNNRIDFYAFGCDFFRPCMDLERSVVLGPDNLKEAMDLIANGENVVLLANHQSEADPQVVSCMFEKAGYGKQAEDMVYVAGHKVTTDALAIPFSMGRNLICIHSKKHINADKDTKPTKQRQNLKAMQAMLTSLKMGGCLLWVAPSGGRDRRDASTGNVPIAEFDSKTIDMFRLMGNKSKKPTHYYTLAMDSYDLCPPPDHVEPGVGEERNVQFVPVGIAMGKECASVGGLEGRKEFCNHAFEQCQQDYKALRHALGKA